MTRVINRLNKRVFHGLLANMIYRMPGILIRNGIYLRFVCHVSYIDSFLSAS